LTFLVSFIFLASCSQIEPTVTIPQLDFPEKRSSSAIAITSNGSILLVVNPDSNSLSILDTGELAVLDEIEIGRDPRTVSVDVWGKVAVTANRGAGSISVIDLEKRERIADVEVGGLPWGVILSQDGGQAYIACEADDWIAVVDLEKLEVSHRVRVEARPNGLALSRDGSKLYVTHLLTARVSIINLHNHTLEGVISTWVDGNLSQSIVLHPGLDKAYMPLTRSNTTNVRLTFDTTVFPLVTVVDLEKSVMLPKEILSLPEADQPVGLPYDAAFLPNGSKLYVANAASNDVSAIDMTTGFGIANLEVGDNPRGLVVSPDGQRAYVNNTLAGTVTVIDTDSDKVVDVIEVTQIPLPPALLHGKRLFHASRDPDLSKQSWISCNTCHWEGEHDGRTWTFSFSGPRNTTSLLGMINTYPLRWSGEWDESADSEFAITEEQFGEGLIGGEIHPTLGEPNTGRSYDLDSLALFIDSLAFLPNLHSDEVDPDLLFQGQRLFFDAQVGCAECHPPPYYTNFEVHDVGTASGPSEVLGPEIDTPTLLSLGRSAPFLHDGSAVSLTDVLTTSNPDDQHGMTSQLTSIDRDALVAFMLALSPPVPKLP
jgi:YVTN family beta-propeller protein